MARYLAQIVMGAQVVGRDFARGRCKNLQPAARPLTPGAMLHTSLQPCPTNLSGLSLQEAQQILSVSKLNPEEIQKNYKHLFKVNDKSVGDSFYLQSKVVWAKERLDEELKIQAQEVRGKEPKT